MYDLSLVTCDNSTHKLLILYLVYTPHTRQIILHEIENRSVVTFTEYPRIIGIHNSRRKINMGTTSLP